MVARVEHLRAIRVEVTVILWSPAGGTLPQNVSGPLLRPYVAPLLNNAPNELLGDVTTCNTVAHWAAIHAVAFKDDTGAGAERFATQNFSQRHLVLVCGSIHKLSEETFCCWRWSSNTKQGGTENDEAHSGHSIELTNGRNGS